MDGGRGKGLTSRYIHCRCTVSSSSTTSMMCERTRSHRSTSCSNALTKRDAFIVDSFTWLSSRAVKTSSVDLTHTGDTRSTTRLIVKNRASAVTQQRNFSLMLRYITNYLYWNVPCGDTSCKTLIDVCVCVYLSVRRHIAKLRQE